MDILTFPAPSLTMPSSEIKDPTASSIQELAKSMADIIYATHGCGIAAPQIGQNIRLIVVDCSSYGDERHPIYAINPTIISKSDETDSGFEGCLSVPGVMIELDRSSSVDIEWMDFTGKLMKGTFEGLWSRCFQHEIDHLDGITMLDRLAGMKKLKAASAYAQARKAGVVPGGEPMFAI